MCNRQFQYQVTKDQKVLIFWNNKQVMITKGKKAAQLMMKLEAASPDEAEMYLAKITGNFKRGNEKDNR